MGSNGLDLGNSSSLPFRSLTAGVVAHNEEANLRSAVSSLVDQELPNGVRWDRIWIVASGCTDGTVDVARSLSDADARVRVVVEPDRGGKARALGEVFRRASGDALVLLNADARAEPGAIHHLLRAAAGKPEPYAVMARPVLPGQTAGRWVPTFEWMWELHHQLHAELLSQGNGRHLSDELLLVSLPSVLPIPVGIINDGSYLAVWLSQHSGGRWYASDARVSIQVPSTVRDHLHQRRRIHVGNAQVRSVLGVPATTASRQFLEHPVETVRLLRQMLARENGVGHFARLATWEIAAHALALWDRLPPRKDHVRWQRIRPAPRETGPLSLALSSAPCGPDPLTATARRVTALLDVASEFGTGLPLGQLRELLPANGPGTVEELGRWLKEHPELGRLDGALAFAAASQTQSKTGRSERARQYRQAAEKLWSGPLSFGTGLVRCAAITGSVAFGEPREGDDLDLFVVTRTGSLWWFLARTYFALLIARHQDVSLREPVPCLNYVIEDSAVATEFARPADLLFAREALSVQVLRGDDYYRGLVAASPWMRKELPFLYDARARAPGRIASERAPGLIRLLNAVAFPLLAAYLQLAGLVRNSRLDRAVSSGGGFRTEAGRRRLVFASRRFEELRERYVTDASSGTAREARPGPTHGPTPP